MFSETSAMIREICNGIICVSALMLAVVFGRYALAAVRKDYRAIHDTVSQAAFALLFLMVGDAIRAFSGWMQFLWLRHDWDPGYWANGIELFLLATALIVLGKTLMLYTFSPFKWGWCVVAGIMAAAVVIPIIVAVVTF